MMDIFFYGTMNPAPRDTDKRLSCVQELKVTMQGKQAIFSARIGAATADAATKPILLALQGLQRDSGSLTPILCQWTSIAHVGVSAVCPAGFALDQYLTIVLKGDYEVTRLGTRLYDLAGIMKPTPVSCWRDGGDWIEMGNKALDSMGFDSYSVINHPSMGVVLIDGDEDTTGGSEYEVRGFVAAEGGYTVYQCNGFGRAVEKMSDHGYFSQALKSLLSIPSLEIIEEEWAT